MPDEFVTHKDCYERSQATQRQLLEIVKSQGRIEGMLGGIDLRQKPCILRTMFGWITRRFVNGKARR